MAKHAPHRLAVILHADVAGSTALVRKDERVAHERIQQAFQGFSQAISNYGGVVSEVRGDALLAEFARASDAVRAALTAQTGNVDRNAGHQDDIVKNILAEIEGELVWAHGPGIWAGMTGSLDAYLQYLQGQKALFRFEQEHNLAARKHANKAIELNANCSGIYEQAGRYREAMELIHTALRLSPYPPAWFVRVKARTSFLVGDYASTIDLFTNTETWNESSRKMAHAFLAAAFHASGRIEEAAASVARLLELDPNVTAQRINGSIPSRYEQASRDRLIRTFVATGIPE